MLIFIFNYLVMKKLLSEKQTYCLNNIKYIIKHFNSSKGSIKAKSYSTTNFKDVVESFACQKGIIFKPISNNLNLIDGKKYYQFGNTTIYIDRGVIFVNNKQDNIWSPISIQDLIDMVES